jgi:hypothetical protein
MRRYIKSQKRTSIIYEYILPEMAGRKTPGITSLLVPRTPARLKRVRNLHLWSKNKSPCLTIQNSEFAGNFEKGVNVQAFSDY